ncbi:MAG: helix-turn-helix transcriptional regulator [Ruminococcaceae bacterium]|nr:helix-turn-helix transcriptional regulator [Oscillospiraceae bacterium]
MKERIKQIRNHEGCTQSAFGEKLGVKGNTVTGWETGIRTPSDAIIKSICRIFNINEDWLRTGEGEMQTPISRDAAIAAFMNDVMKGEDANFRKRLIAALSKLDVSEWELLEKVARNLAAESKEQASDIQYDLQENTESNTPVSLFPLQPQKFHRQAMLSSPVIMPGVDGPVELSRSDADPENTP